MPLVSGPGLDCISLTLPIRIDELDYNEVRVRHGICISDRKRVLKDLLDRPPDVDDLVAGGKKFLLLVGEMMPNTGATRLVGLVNVYALDWTAKIGGWNYILTLVLRCTADGMVEDEDARGAGSRRDY